MQTENFEQDFRVIGIKLRKKLVVCHFKQWLEAHAADMYNVLPCKHVGIDLIRQHFDWHIGP